MLVSYFPCINIHNVEYWKSDLFLAFFVFKKPGGEAVIALSKDSRIHQNQICEGNGIAPLIRLLRISKLAEGTLLSVIRAVGSMCIGL